jgi:Leucine-rich repeat (LRR) protein
LIKNNKFNHLINTFAGPMPDVKKLSALRSLYFSYNHFSGEIPDDAFEGMGSLKKVFLSNNEFTGKIPSSLASLHRLMLLGLDGNKFEGQIPDFQQKGLKKLNVSNNDLMGPIPASLSKMDSNSFLGNHFSH